jgi:hypothetical protein
LPEEDPAEWALHLADLRAALRPQDAYEEKLVAALAAAMWREVRADRVECDVMAEIPPLPNRSHGGDLQEPRHAASLTTAIRYQTAAGMAAQRALLAHRKARQDGLAPAVAAAEAAAAPAPALEIESAANQDEPVRARVPAGPPRPDEEFCTNGLPPPAPPDEPEPEPDALPGRAAVPGRRRADDGTEDEGLDDEAWLATVPVVESDPEREAERRRALLRVESPMVRRTIGHAPLRHLEQYLAAGDPVAYEA